VRRVRALPGAGDASPPPGLNTSRDRAHRWPPGPLSAETTRHQRYPPLTRAIERRRPTGGPVGMVRIIDRSPDTQAEVRSRFALHIEAAPTRALDRYRHCPRPTQTQGPGEHPPRGRGPGNNRRRRNPAPTKVETEVPVLDHETGRSCRRPVRSLRMKPNGGVSRSAFCTSGPRRNNSPGAVAPPASPRRPVDGICGCSAMPQPRSTTSIPFWPSARAPRPSHRKNSARRHLKHQSSSSEGDGGARPGDTYPARGVTPWLSTSPPLWWLWGQV
jgi:hypothetical protein